MSTEQREALSGSDEDGMNSAPLARDGSGEA
jgi:hypothetical protein